MQEAIELRDKVEIIELITRYAILNDSGEWEAVAQMYVFRDTTRPDARERRSMEFRGIAYYTSGK